MDEYRRLHNITQNATNATNSTCNSSSDDNSTDYSDRYITIEFALEVYDEEEYDEIIEEPEQPQN